MAGSHVISLLSKKYAQLLGEFEFAERDVGDASGLQAIIAATERSDKRKREIEEQLQAIETVIWLFDPDWDPALVRPNYPRQKAMGEISLAAYGVLRRAEAPMTTRELARAVAGVLGYENPGEREIARIDSAINASLSNKLGKTIEIASQNPIRWALISRKTVARPRRRSLLGPDTQSVRRGNSEKNSSED